MIPTLVLLAFALADVPPATTQEEGEAQRRCAALLDDPGSPLAARHLFALQRLRDFLPPGTTEACVDRLLAAPRLSPDLRRAAAALRASWAEDDGDDARAAAEAARAGTAVSWRIAGPFADPERNPLAGGGTVEEAVGAVRAGRAGALPGRDGPVEFLDLPVPRADGAIDVARAVPVDQGACVLLRATLAPPAAHGAALLLGGAPALSVWIDPTGAAAAPPATVPAVRDGTAPARLSVPLPRGARGVDVLVGVCPAGGDAVIRAFLGAGETAVERAQRRVAGTARGADARLPWLDAAELLVESGALPATEDPLGVAPDAAADPGPVALLRARSGVTDADRAAAAAEALRLLPDDLEALLAVAREASALPGRPGVREALDRAAAEHADSLRAGLANAREWLVAEMPLQADAVLAPFSAGPAPVALLRARMDVAAALGRVASRRALAEALLADRPADAAAWSARIDAAVDAGAYDEIRAWLSDAPFGGAASGPLASLELERLAARTALRLGDVDAAVARLERLAAERPADETAWFDLGWALARADREDDAERALRRGLVLRPTDALARSWIAAREPPDPDLERWLGTGEGDVPSHDDLRADFPDAPAAYALRAVAVTLDPGGGARERHHRVLEILQPSGADATQTLPLASFDPTRTVFRATSLQVRASDGTSRGGATIAYRGGNAPDVRLFTATQLATVSLPRLQAGDRVDVQFEPIDVGASSLPDGALAREVPEREAWPTALLRVVAAAPAGVTLRLDAPPEERARTERGSSGGREWVLWEAREVPAVVDEPLGPPPREAGRAVRVTTFGSWAEVGAWIGGLFREYGADARIAALAAAGTVPAIYRAVASTVRYVAAEYGSHGLAPAPPAVTLARGYGDCKDKTALLVDALAAAGIAARPALVRSRAAGAEPAAGAFAFPFDFDHVVAYLPPPIDRYVDATATRLPWDVLPRGDRGATGLVLDPDGARLVVLPAAAPDDEGLERRELLFCDPTGEAALVGTLHAGGADAGDLRELLAAPDLRAGIVGVLLARDLPDAQIVAVDVDGLEPDERLLDVEYVGSVPGFATPVRDGLRTPLGVTFDLVARFAALARRDSDLELSGAGFPVRWRRDVQIGLSGNWSWSDLPDGAREIGPCGSFVLDVRLEGGMLHVSVDLTIPCQRVAASEYSSFRAFLGRVDALLAQTAAAVRREPGE